MNQVESNIIQLLNQKNYTNFPQLYKKDIFMNKPGLVMERFGHTLKYYLDERKRFSFTTTIQIGV